jgi:hypothetical protein
MFNRFVKLIISALSLGLSLLACSNSMELKDLNVPQSKVEKVSMTPAAITLKDGTNTFIGAKVSPWSATAGQTIVWSSANPEIADVNQQGQVFALKVGETDIIAQAEEVQGICRVTVVSSRIPAETISFLQSSGRVKIGSKLQRIATVEPATSTDIIAYQSSDESIATVDATGTIAGKKEGYVTITASAGERSATMEVLVHGDLWMEQVDPLIKPTNWEYHPFKRDTIRVARGETATAQMIVYADSNQGTVTPSLQKFAVKGSDGVAFDSKLFWVRDVRCTEQWMSWFGGPPSDRYPHEQYDIPDALMPLSDWQVNLSAGQSGSFWIEVTIPRDAQPGLYECVAAIQGAQTAELPYVVEVYDVTLPEKQTLSIMQWLHQNLTAMNGGEPTEMYQVYNWFEHKIIPLVREYGQNCFNSQYYWPYLTNRKLVQNADGEWEMTANFSQLGREIEMYLRACPDLHYVQGGNIISSAAKKGEGILVLLGLELNEDGTPKLGAHLGGGVYEPVWTYVDQGAEYSKEAEAYFSLYFHALQEYLRSHELADGRTWLDIYLQTMCDEPGDKAARAYEWLGSYVKKGAPDLITMEPIGTHNISDKVLDIPCPCIDVLTGPRGYEYTENQIPWIYSAVGPQGEGLNRFIRIPLIKTRLMHWLNWRYHTVGYLHWGPNYWQGARVENDPWTDANGQFPGGDMWIIWPGDETVYPSIRLAAMRDGIRDYELLKMVSEKEGLAKADQFCNEIVQDTWNYSTDVEVFRAQRKAILDCLAGRTK